VFTYDALSSHHTVRFDECGQPLQNSAKRIHGRDWNLDTDVVQADINAKLCTIDVDNLTGNELYSKHDNNVCQSLDEQVSVLPRKPEWSSIQLDETQYDFRCQRYNAEAAWRKPKLTRTSTNKDVCA
jgi:hypothetical protein